MAEFHFRSMEASQNKSDGTIQFLVGGLFIHFAGIFHLSCSVQKLNLTPKIFIANLETPKRHYLRKSASTETDCYHFWHIAWPCRLNQLCKILYRSVKGLRCGRGPKIVCSHRKAESSITLRCTIPNSN
jgi:hypothetical protein